MRAELRDFYFKNVKPNLASLNEQRKKNSMIYYGVTMILLDLFLCVFFIGDCDWNYSYYSRIGDSYIFWKRGANFNC